MSLGFEDDPLELPESEVSDITFGSAEARFALLQARRLRLVLHIAAMSIVLLAAICVAILARAGGVDGLGAMAGGSAGHGGSGERLNIDPIGSKDAKVQIVAVLPPGSECHSGVAKLLADTATARPDEIHVEFVSINQFAVKEPDLQAKIGDPCAAVIINEEVNFKLMTNGKERAVTLIGNAPANYKMSDVGEAITQVYTAQYGDPGEPIYTVEEKKCSGGAGTCDSEHEDHGDTQPAEPEEEPAPIVLPDKIPDLEGVK